MHGRAERGDGTGKFRPGWDGSEKLPDQTGWFARAEKSSDTKFQGLNRRGSASTNRLADALKGGAGRWNWGFSTLLIGTKPITRPDRMVCSCREELEYEVSGPESTGIGFHELDCWCIEGRSREMELGIFDIVGTEVKNFQTRPDGLLVPRRAWVRSFRV